jgi:hypothetical protein
MGKPSTPPPPPPPPPPPTPISLSSLQLDKSLKRSLMALELVSGTVSPSDWTTSSAVTSTEAPGEKGPLPEPPIGASTKPSTKVLVETSREPIAFAMLPGNVLEYIFYKVST